MDTTQNIFTLLGGKFVGSNNSIQKFYICWKNVHFIRKWSKNRDPDMNRVQKIVDAMTDEDPENDLGIVSNSSFSEKSIRAGIFLDTLLLLPIIIKKPFE